MLKRIMTIFLCVSILLVVAACEKQNNNQDFNSHENKEQITENVTEEIIEQSENMYLNNTYVTRFGEINDIQYPVYSFDYSDNWEITNEECNSTQEFVTLTNERGVKVTFSHWNALESETFQYGGTGITNVEINEVANSNFVPGSVYGKDYSDFGDFMVAKIAKTSFEDGITGETMPCDGCFFAVLPKTEMGAAYYKTAIEAAFSFWHGNYISFVCMSPDFNYTEEEEKEIIEIMCSFRVNTIESAENIKLTNTYKTKYQDICLKSYPYFEFDYPDNWAITYEKCENYEEYVTLSNERGVEIEFSHMNDEIQTSDETIREIQVIKVYESNYIPDMVQETDYSLLGAFVVARFKQMDDRFVYGVIPESYISSEGTIVGTYGSAYSFPYNGDISFKCDVKDMRLTEQEQSEVMAILGSFREVGCE